MSDHDESAANVDEDAVLLETAKIDVVDLDLVKGDCVGDTVYSGKWIISTLIALSKVNDDGWSEDFEGDICMLWDMSADKDIVSYLLDNDFLKLAENVLSRSTEHRLTEIVLGIIANMACQTTALDMIGRDKELTSTVLSLLSSDDAESLMQIVRLLQAVVSDVYNNQQSVWLDNLVECKFIGEALIFILKSSTNEDLLMAMTDLLYTIACREPTHDEDSLLERLFVVKDLIPAMLELLNEVIPSKRTSYSQDDLQFIQSWLSILRRITESLQLDVTGEENVGNLEKLAEVTLRLLRPYEESSNLIPVDENVALCVHELLELALWLESNGGCFMPDVNCVVASMMYELDAVLKNNVERGEKYDPDDAASKLSKYLEHWMRTG